MLIMRSFGFGLVELVAGLALVAVIAGAGALKLPEVLASLRLTGAVQRLSAALRQARGRALERGGPVELQLDDVRGLWELRDVSGPVVARDVLTPGIRFSSLPASRRVRFTAIGTSDNATIALDAGGPARRIVVNQRGRVRVQ